MFLVLYHVSPMVLIALATIFLWFGIRKFRKLKKALQISLDSNAA
jgi:hypothetical protein